MTKLERDECVLSSVKLCLQSVPHTTDTAAEVSAALRGHREGWVAEGGGNVTTKSQDPNRNLLLAVVVLFLVIHALDPVGPIPLCVFPAPLSCLLDSKHQRFSQSMCVCVLGAAWMLQ